MPQDDIRSKVIYLRNAARRKPPLACRDPHISSFPDVGPAGFDFSSLDDEAEKLGEARLDDKPKADR